MHNYLPIGRIIKNTLLPKMRILVLPFLMFVSFSACGQNFFTDKRDSTAYEIVQIDNSFWFKENLKYKTPASWCSENPDSEACQYGNYYYPTDLISVCPANWRVPTWIEYKAAIKEIEKYYGLSDSIKYEKNRLHMYKDLLLEGEGVFNLTLIDDSTFFDLSATGWIQGDKWEPQNQTTLWIIHDLSNTPQPHIHVRQNEITMHSHGHHVLDKPKNLRRFAVRCISEVSQDITNQR